MKRRSGVLVALCLGVTFPALLATGACWLLWGAEPRYLVGQTGVTAGVFHNHIAAIEVGALITFLGIFVAFILSRTVHRYSRNMDSVIREIWQKVAGQPLHPDDNEEDLVALARAMALEFSILRKSESDLKAKVIRLEHTLSEHQEAGETGELELHRLAQAKAQADRACANLRDQVRDLEERLARVQTVSGDNWFARLVRDLLAPFHIDPEAERTADATPERRVLADLLGLASHADADLADLVPAVNLGEVLGRAVEKMENKDRVRSLLSPFAAQVRSNPVPLELLLDRILVEVDRRAEDVTIRAWRQRSTNGKDRVRLAIEQHRESIKNFNDCAALHGLAALAGSTVTTEAFGDNRVAHVLYFDAAGPAEGFAMPSVADAVPFPQEAGAGPEEPEPAETPAVGDPAEPAPTIRARIARAASDRDREAEALQPRRIKLLPALDAAAPPRAKTG
ncbi:MAG: hypothetical protein JXQ29_01005 [Planctomycetes bacterium]|nr:hypothetical protein [Planctomycetota bacterium]